MFKKLKYFMTSQSRLAARRLDSMKERPGTAASDDLPKAPPDEFNKIMAIMEERGIEPGLRKQLKRGTVFGRAGGFLQKPALAAFLVLLLLGGTSLGVSAKRAYDYQMREMKAGKGEIIWNNDPAVLVEKGNIDEAYDEIREKLGIKPLRPSVMPFDMKYDRLEIKDGNATLKFIYHDKRFFFIQAKNDKPTSLSIVSSRKKREAVYNDWLDQYITIEENGLGHEETEYSAYLSYSGAYFYLSGIMNENEFLSIIENLSF